MMLGSASFSASFGVVDGFSLPSLSSWENYPFLFYPQHLVEADLSPRL